MKAFFNQRKNPKPDWHVLAVDMPAHKNEPDYEIQYVTSGFSKHGFKGEVCTYGKVKDAEK